VLGSRRSPIPVQQSSGIPKALRDLIITAPFNDFEYLERIFKQAAHDVAAIIVEPMLGNCAAIEPAPGFLEHIRKLCDQYGVVFILDEVKTGFRVARGGAQELFNIRPDMATYAKALGNSYPIACFGGKREIMDIVGNGVAHAGTYTGNTLGVAAAEKVLEILEDGSVLNGIAERGRQIQKGISDVLEHHGRPFVVTGHPAMFSYMFADHQPKDYRDWAASDHDLYDEVTWELIERGVMPDPDSREPWFLAAAHSEQDVSDTLNAFEDAVKTVMARH
jgi:glutamate-1-semialdehyde 2,1-aminomutase